MTKTQELDSLIRSRSATCARIAELTGFSRTYICARARMSNIALPSFRASPAEMTDKVLSAANAGMEDAEIQRTLGVSQKQISMCRGVFGQQTMAAEHRQWAREVTSAQAARHAMRGRV